MPRTSQRSSPPATLAQLRRELADLADPNQAALLMRFFKTAPGQYGHGDRFLGIKVPPQRALARKHDSLPLADIESLLADEFHEHRLTALIILTRQYEKADPARRKAIFDFYLAHTARINNWDLVDVSAPNIVGDFLHRNPGLPVLKLLDSLARSASLWERRIAILATLAFIRAGVFSHTLRIARLLLHDGHDLIHKASGWMLREVAKRDQPLAESFLQRHAPSMPRTTLRYAIERFPPALKARFLAVKGPRPGSSAIPPRAKVGNLPVS